MSSAQSDEKKTMMGNAFSKASQIMTGVGTPLSKQLKAAIIESNEDKAISIYNAKEMGKALKSTLHPSKPFPSKKDPNGETPLHLSSKYALATLFGMFLEFGGRPDITNPRQETCLHTVCTQMDSAAKRAEIVEQILKWRSINPSTNKSVAVSADSQDIDGNTPMHLAASNGLLACIERMLAHQVSAWLLNNHNMTSAELADVSGRAAVGSMIELAWLFRPSAGPGGSNARFDRALITFRTRMRDYGGEDLGIVMMDSDSLTVASLMRFVARLIAFISEKLNESAARAEVLLMHYNWDGRNLIKEYSEDPDRVTSLVNIQCPEGLASNSGGDGQALTVQNGEETAVALQNINTMSVGIPISEVYLDPSYQNLGPFTVVRGGKKVSYTIRTVHGRTAVVPLDFDPSAKMLTHNDQKVSPNSHLRPETTSPCPMCGEMMHEAASVQHFVADTLVEPKHRELACGSGHKFCFSCWAGYLKSHAASEEGLSGLCCPAVNCGEVLDLHWAPVLLKSPDLLNRIFAQRQRLIIEKLRLRWCPVPECNLIVHVHSAEGEAKRGSDVSAAGIPLCGLCANNHTFCLCCGVDAHSPLKCDEVSKWQDLKREVSRLSQARDSNSAASILIHAPNHKNCTQCGTSNGKEDGCNHMRCTGCFREYCWTCLKDWSLHQADGAQCNLLHDQSFSNGLNDRQATFLRYFARYQVHQESSALETAMSTNATDRVVSELKATHDGELQWLLGDGHPVPPMNAHAVNNGTAALEDRDVKLADAYTNREKALTFLTDAFVELKKCRTLLRWSYPFALFRFEGEFRQATAGRGMMMVATSEDEAEYKHVFFAVQGALERCTEALSDLIAHKRLRGSKDDIVEATLLAKTERIALEGIVVGNSQTFGSKSLEFSRSASRSVDEREFNVKPSSPMHSLQQQQSQRMQQQASSSRQESINGESAAVNATSKVSSYMQAMEFDMADQQQQRQKQAVASSPAPVAAPAPVSITVAASTVKNVNIDDKMKPDSGEDYGYNSGDEEGLQTLTDVSLLRLGDSGKVNGGPVPSLTPKTLQPPQQQQQQEQQQRPQQKASSEKEITEVTTLEAERSSHQAVEQTFSTITTKRIMTATGSTLVSNDSGNSLMSDLTTQDNNGSGTPVTFTRMNKLIPLSPNKPPVDPNSLPQHIPHANGNNAPKGPITTRGLTRHASKLFQKEIIEHISEEETVIVYQLMNKHKIDRDKAVRMYLEEHDERLYNPKAVYLFPGEVYTPVEEIDDEEEQRRKADLFGRVEYNHKTKEETSDSYSVSTAASVVEQRLIGAKKDPDQEALEHALLLSGQEDEFGINMYDSMSPEDHITLEEYMSQGFTREEGALIIFEEKFGKTKFTRNSEVIPAMPTLQPVHSHMTMAGSMTDRSGRSGSYYQNGSEVEEEDDPEVVDLMRRGYTREQAFAVIEHHREKAIRAAATQHPTDPTFYDPHPREDQLNLSEREEREVQIAMEQRRCSRRVAVDIVVAARASSTVSRSATNTTSAAASQNLYSAGYDDRINESSEDLEVRRYIDHGYTREQALQLVRSKQSIQGRTVNSLHSDTGHQDPPAATRRPSFGSTNSGGNESALTSLTLEEAEIARYTNRGYSREQAREMVRRDSGLNGTASYSSSTYSINVPASPVPSSRARSVPSNLDPETAELVRQQNEDYGVNMFTAGTAEDDAVVERLMNDGYTYNQALLHAFSYRYPPRQPAPMPVPQPVYQYQPQQSFYQPPQPQYGMPQGPYGSPAPYPAQAQGSFYQPNGGSFYQQSPPPPPMQYPAQGDMYGSPYPAPAPAAAVNVNNNLARKPSSLSSNNSNGSGGGSKPPVLNGNQTSLLQQQRNQDAWVAQQQPIEKKASSNAMTRKGSFLGGIGGITRKSAHTEDDLVARANYQAEVDNGKRDPDNKYKVPKLKYKEADVQKIVKMGFTRDQAVQALIENHQNVDQAVHTLTDR